MFSFESIRNEGRIYIDKTARLFELINNCSRCFLSRPRRFGKSLNVSTLEAMFGGKAEFFVPQSCGSFRSKGLAADEWVKEQEKHPNPVLKSDMRESNTRDIVQFDLTFREMLDTTASLLDIELNNSSLGGKLKNMILELYKRGGSVVVLIDEYDKPILDSINDAKKAEEVRAVLRSFYTVLKGCEKYLRFVMLTGISKSCPTGHTYAISKVGIFSAINNLVDISMDRRFGDIVGYTQ